MRPSRTCTYYGLCSGVLCVVWVGVMLFPLQAAEAHDGQRRTVTQPGQQPQRYARSIGTYRPPNVTLVDMSGSSIPLVAILNRPGPLLLQFIFTTCPTICPALSSTFSAAQDKLGADPALLRMVSISIDPEHDTPERLQLYAQKLKAKPHWQFLTGKLDDIVAVQKAFGAYRGNKMRHEPLTYLRASPADPWIRLDGFMSVAELVREYQRLVAP